MKTVATIVRFTLFAAVTVGAAGIFLAPARGADRYWNGNGTIATGTWNDASTNWQTAFSGGSATTFTTGTDSAIFNADTITGGTVTLGLARSAAGVTFNTGGLILDATNILTIGAGGITQTTAAGSPNQIGTGVNGTGNVTLSASQAWLNQSNHQFTNRDGLLVLGAHTLTFTSTGGGGITAANTTSDAGSIIVSANTSVGMSGNNTYSGTTTINGTLTVNSFGNFNAPSGVGTKISNVASNLVLDGGTLRVQVNNATSDRLFTVGAGGATFESMLTGGNSGRILLTGATAVTYSGVGNRTITIGGTSDDAGGSSIARVIGDVGGGNGTVALANTGGHAWTVSGTNTYTGGTTVTAGSLTMGSASALGSTSGQLTVNGGTLNMATNSLTVGNLTGTGGTISGTSGARMLTIGQGDNGGGNFQGTIANGAAGTTALTKTGTGTITLSGINTYTGATNVNAGTLLVNGDHTGGGTYAVGANGTLGGTGSISGSVAFNGTSLLNIVNLADPLIVANSGNTFGAGFGIDNLIGIDWGTLDLNTTYTALSTNQVFSDSDIENFGFANRTSVGGGREAYFTNGSLAFVVVPEPATMAMVGAGVAILGFCLARRRKANRIGTGTFVP